MKSPPEPPRNHKNYRKRGPRKLCFTYQELADYTGKELTTVRARFKWTGIPSLMSYISAPTIKSSMLLSPEEVKGVLSQFGPADDAMAYWRNRWPRLYLYWCCESDCKSILFAPGRCEKHGGGRPVIMLPLYLTPNNHGHFRIRVNDRYESFHRIVMGCPRGMDVHHADFNVWNNRVENLRELPPKDHLLIHAREGGMFHRKGTRLVRDGNW